MEIRTMVVYEYTRFDFEYELDELSSQLSSTTPVPTDEEWVAIQNDLQKEVNDAVDAIIRQHLYNHINYHKEN
ncbi:hypothetical protein UFOVP325_56 [uncultured Caudovirales phage]|uniref:Uncharacterized protein n=1 Tax=uncultured Caudovirales phage TaxID=2100421 RepID=A0A6J5LWV1_9CAUD|nr:hypothetical protein UFOVP325_56 [uncultured Caudovirales phage]CAB4147900.1 hypothetical protein UFOVP430_51 [uncultured Caudovirales phage]